MNNIQEILFQLQSQGWTVAAIADELKSTPDTVFKWRSGQHYPHKAENIVLFLTILRTKKPPKQRRYPGTHHLQREAASRVLASQQEFISAKSANPIFDVQVPVRNRYPARIVARRKAQPVVCISTDETP